MDKKGWIDRIEERLSTLVPPLPSPVFQAARYSLLAPGKRFRPLLVLGTASAFGKSVEEALDPACAMELIHTYSLIHDDLPCMDDDDLRRGRPTLHKVYGEGMALLAGDYLLTYAFEVLAKGAHLSPAQKVDLIQTLASSAGANGMIGGQAIDLAAQGKVLDEISLETMHIGKTAKLLAASLEFGAIIADAPEETRKTLVQIGEKAGLAYQILDDILDRTSTTELLGKTVGADLARAKPTAVSLYGVEGAKQRVAELKLEIFEKLAPFPAPLVHLFRELLYTSHE